MRSSIGGCVENSLPTPEVMPAVCRLFGSSPGTMPPRRASAAIIVAWFSRHREFRADRGAAQLMGRKQPMINALARLGGMVPGELPKSLQAMGITSGVGKLFSTHPPIEERIAALQNAQ